MAPLEERDEAWRSWPSHDHEADDLIRERDDDQIIDHDPDIDDDDDDDDHDIDNDHDINDNATITPTPVQLATLATSTNSLSSSSESDLSHENNHRENGHDIDNNHHPSTLSAPGGRALVAVGAICEWHHQ